MTSSSCFATEASLEHVMEGFPMASKHISPAEAERVDAAMIIRTTDVKQQTFRCPLKVLGRHVNIYPLYRPQSNASAVTH